MKRFFAASTLLIAAISDPASAELKYNNNSGGSVLLYGHFNPAYLSVDDGESTSSDLVDSAHSNSRVGLTVAQPLSWGTFGFNFETGIGAPGSSGFSQVTSPNWDWQRTSLRKVDFSFKSPTYGTFYIGQGSMASDSVAQQDLSGTTLVLYSAIGDTAGGYQFRTASGALSGVTIGGVMPDLDGARRGRVRYDTPSFNGFTFAVAAGQEILSSTNEDEYYDVALKYDNDFDGTRVKGAIGWSRRDGSDGAADVDDTFGSIAVLLPSGFNFGIAAGDRDTGGSYWYGKVGYKGNWFPIGQTAVAIDYYDGDDFNRSGSSSSSWGIGVVQSLGRYNSEVYAAYRSYEYSDAADSYQDMSSYFLGARWKF